MITKTNEVMPEQPVIVLLYGVPGSGKTSVATTANKPLVIDTDRGAKRAVKRVDTIFANNWDDILADINSGAFKDYKTIILDTAKSCLDDYISEYVVRQDFKLKKNTLKRFGAMGDEFKNFVNAIRANGTDIIFICHDKETQEGDIIRHAPDCTGQSKNLLVRIADQVGYVSYINGTRVINCGPMDCFETKNTAEFPIMEIPEYNTSEFEHFMADFIQGVKDRIISRDSAQKEAHDKLDSLRSQLSEANSDETISALMIGCKELPKPMQMPFFSEMKETLATKGWSWSDEEKRFIKTAA